MNIKHKVEYILFLILGRLFSFFGIISIPTSAKILAGLFFSFLRIRRDIVTKNLSLAFPNLSANEISSLAYENYKSIAITFLEILNMVSLPKEKFTEIFTTQNMNLVEEKLKLNKGLILLTGHFGNWEIGALSTGIYLDHPLGVLVKKQKNPYVANWLTKFRERFGNYEITLGTSVKELYKAIKSKNAVGIVGDQRGRRDGIIVEFFGQKTATFPGAAAIALKLRCPVVIILCARQPNGVYEGIIKELKFDDLIDSSEKNLIEFNQRYMNILEEVIRKYPEQWFWMHNIWKY